MSRAVILLRTSDRNAAARQRFRDTAARLQERHADTPVLAAYLTPGGTSSEIPIGRAVEHVVAGGAMEIAVVPYDVDWSYPELYDVPDALYDLAAEYPGVTFRMARPLGLAADVDDVVGRRLAEAWCLPAAGRATVRQVAEMAGQTPVSTARLPEGEVPRLPAHAQHLFVCFGRRCMEEGSPAAYQALVSLLAARGLDAGPERVKVSRNKCLSPCAGAPVACVYPAGEFVSHLDAEAMPAFVDDVLVGGGALPGRTFRPGA